VFKMKAKDNSRNNEKIIKGKTTVLSLGGSLIAPDDVDTDLLKDFVKIVNTFVNKGNKLIIVCGGGGTNSRYNKKAKEISSGRIINDEDLDWLGIAATKLNAELLRVIFGDAAYERVLQSPNETFDTDKKIVIASGWKPGWSTDYDAVLLAINSGSERVINFTNIDYVYDKDPKKYKDAKKLEMLSWKEYLKIVGGKWEPRMNAPFDPIASKMAMEKGIKVFIVNGKKVENIRKVLLGEKVKGTIIG